MNENFKNIIEQNKDFIEYIHILFMHFYRIESKKTLENIEERMISNIFKELSNKECYKYIHNIDIISLDNSKYKIKICDYESKSWSFEIDIRSPSNIKLLSHYFILPCGFFMSSSESSELDLDGVNIVEFHNRKINKEDIEMIILKHDLDISVYNLNDISFKHVDSLRFIKEL